MFGVVPKALWEKTNPADDKNRIDMSARCLLIEDGKKLILVDAGLGDKQSEKFFSHYSRWGDRTLVDSLKAEGFSPDDITDVFFTHLHFDHCGGSTRLDRAGNIVPTFPKATYYIQRSCWEDAQNPNERCSAFHREENFMPIEEKSQLELLDGDTEILPGLNLVVTDGHAIGHQMVLFNHGGERVVFLGDIVPTHHHLNLPVISAFSFSPEETLQRKKEILSEAEQQGWLIVFSHGTDTKAGYLERRGNTTYLRPVEL